MKNLLTAVERLFSIAGLIETRRNRSSEEMFQKLILLKMNGFWVNNDSFNINVDAVPL